MLGLEPAIVTGVVLLTGLAELFYHWNIRTPRWIGWFLQRPEMHRIHHARGWHTCNFSGSPRLGCALWDARQSQGDVEHCGFVEEEKIAALLLGRDVREV